MKFATLVLLVILTPSVYAQDLDLNERILDAAVCKMNTKIGNGVCWKFVHKVLQESNATIVDPLEGERNNVKPGDIFYTLGFYRFSGTNDSAIVEGLDPHVAIVYKVLGDNRFMLINQNSSGRRKRSRVMITTVDLNQDFNTVSRGYWFFRPKEGDIFTHDLTHIYKKLPIDHASRK